MQNRSVTFICVDDSEEFVKGLHLKKQANRKILEKYTINNFAFSTEKTDFLFFQLSESNE